MFNIPTSLSEVCLTLSRLIMSTADPWPFSWSASQTIETHQALSISITVFNFSLLFVKMRKIKGFKIGKRLIRVTSWIFNRRRRTRPGYYHRLTQNEPSWNHKSVSKLISWGQRLKKGAKSLCATTFGSGREMEDRVPIRGKPGQVPKGHLAVYVGQKDGDFHRVLVPVIYFNHPLFGQLLKEAEEEYGFNQQGGITLPCCFSEFEQVQTRIASGSRDPRRRLY